MLPPIEQFSSEEMNLLNSLLSSDELYAAVWRTRTEHPEARFIFIPYAFPTTFWGALLALDQSFLLPCLHDEPYARHTTYRYLFSQVRGMLANSHAEGELAKQLYTIAPERVHVPGEGIDLTPRGDGVAFRRQRGMPADLPLLLYVGRRGDPKNTPLLLAYVREYWARRGKPFRLMLAGQGDIPIPAALDATHNHDAPVLDLGFISHQEKHDAYAAATIFVLPSIYESFSIVLMEAWLQGTPALVHADCAVTVDHCRRSGGGLAFRDFGSFAAAVDLLLARPDLNATMGARGREFVLATCNWEAVARKTAAAVLG
ncbi:MAG: glycosyltransferase family 4 protein [Chloroflexaceae bacterium]|nr:glycosyltransferase family 4 protein [Chloroflexaceae bacterium]